MALSGSSNYNGTLDSTIDEQWLFEFRNSTYNASVTPDPNTYVIKLGTTEVGSGTAIYHSFILNKPSLISLGISIAYVLMVIIDKVKIE